MQSAYILAGFTIYNFLLIQLISSGNECSSNCWLLQEGNTLYLWPNEVNGGNGKKKTVEREKERDKKKGMADIFRFLPSRVGCFRHSLISWDQSWMF